MSIAFDNPDWLPPQVWSQSRFVGNQSVLVAAHAAVTVPVGAVTPGISLVGYITGSDHAIQVVATQGDGFNDPVSPAGAVMLQPGGAGQLFVPALFYGSPTAAATVINPTNDDLSVDVGTVEFLNTRYADLLDPVLTGQGAGSAIAPAAALGPLWVPQAGLYRTVDVLVVSDRACTVTATWAFAYDDAGWQRATAVDVLGTTGGAGHVHANVPMRGTSLELTVTNDDVLVPAAVQVAWRLS